MSRQVMFWRMVTSSILRHRSRVLIAIPAAAIGATMLSDPITIIAGVSAQLVREIRSYGANLAVIPVGDAPITDGTAAVVTAQASASTSVGSATFGYETVTINDQPYVAGGADLGAVHAMNLYWYVDGEWPAMTGQILVGEQVASTTNVKAGDTIIASQLDAGASSKGTQVQPGAPAPGLKADPRTVTLTVSGILKTGGNEDSYVHMSRQDTSTLTEWTGAVSLVEYSIALGGDQLSAIADTMSVANPDIRTQTVHYLAQSDMGVLATLRSFLVVITVIVFTLTMISVSTTMVAVVTERHNGIGLREALGATARPTTHELVGEGVILGPAGGLLGAGTGYDPVVFISTSVFHRFISLCPVILLGAVICSILIAVLACLPPVRHALTIDPALVPREE